MSTLVAAECPQLIVADLASGAGIVAAREARMPLVINVALPGQLVPRKGEGEGTGRDGGHGHKNSYW